MERAMNNCVKNDNLMLVDGKLYKAFPFTACDECAFDDICDCCREARCASFMRKDRKNVIFKRVQKADDYLKRQRRFCFIDYQQSHNSRRGGLQRGYFRFDRGIQNLRVRFVFPRIRSGA